MIHAGDRSRVLSPYRGARKLCICARYPDLFSPLHQVPIHKGGAGGRENNLRAHRDPGPDVMLSPRPAPPALCIQFTRRKVAVMRRFPKKGERTRVSRVSSARGGGKVPRFARFRARARETANRKPPNGVASGVDGGSTGSAGDGDGGVDSRRVRERGGRKGGRGGGSLMVANIGVEAKLLVWLPWRGCISISDSRARGRARGKLYYLQRDERREERRSGGESASRNQELKRDRARRSRVQPRNSIMRIVRARGRTWWRSTRSRCRVWT